MDYLQLAKQIKEEKGYTKHFVPEVLHLVAGQKFTIEADRYTVIFCPDQLYPGEHIRAESENGVFFPASPDVTQNILVHQGQIKVTNESATPQRVTILKVYSAPPTTYKF